MAGLRAIGVPALASGLEAGARNRVHRDTTAEDAAAPFGHGVSPKASWPTKLRVEWLGAGLWMEAPKRTTP